jgi:thioredoxin
MYIKRVTAYFIGILTLCFSFAVRAQSEFKLSPDEFETKLKTTTSSQLVDVRTPAEYKEKHLKNSLNINYKGKEFNELLTHLDKTKPVFVYCLSGGRSAAAAKIMRDQGFNQVFEMNGGISRWLNEDKPVERAKKSSTGMTLQQFEKLIESKKLVLVDFNARWCAPCIKLSPILDKISKEKSEIVSIVSVDIDANEQIAKHFKVATLPALMLFKNSRQLSSHEGFLDEAGLVEWIKKFE